MYLELKIEINDYNIIYENTNKYTIIFTQYNKQISSCMKYHTIKIENISNKSKHYKLILTCYIYPNLHKSIVLILFCKQ